MVRILESHVVVAALVAIVAVERRNWSGFWWRKIKASTGSHVDVVEWMHARFLWQTVPVVNRAYGKPYRYALKFGQQVIFASLPWSTKPGVVDPTIMNRGLFCSAVCRP
jgi:hypothetical protein